MRITRDITNMLGIEAVAEMQKTYREHYPEAPEEDIRMEIGVEKPTLADRADEIADSQHI